ncbi:MAG: hypothetical protein Q9175_006218 [Cornicularia normoerica]
MIASKLDAVPLRNLKLVCKGTDTWTKDPPELSASEWQQYHSVFEMRARKRRKLQTLGCSGCKKLFDQGLFDDVAAARHTLDKGRLCISCAIQRGSQNKRNIRVIGKEFLRCQECQKAKPLGEDTCLVDKAPGYEDFPEIASNSFVASRGCRGCRDCWTIVEKYRSPDRAP